MCAVLVTTAPDEAMKVAALFRQRFSGTAFIGMLVPDR